MSDLLAEITHAAKAYYAQTTDFPLTATDFFDWLTSLPPSYRAAVQARGFATSQAKPGLLRYCLENRDYAMRPFMAERLSVAAFALWQRHGEFNGDLPARSVSR